MKLLRQKHKPGSVVQRFGDFRKGEPQVILDNQQWLNRGKPDEVEVIFLSRKRSVKEPLIKPARSGRYYGQKV